MIFSGILISAKAIIFSKFYFCGNVLLASLQTFQKLFQYLQPCKFPKIWSYYCPEYFLTTTTMSYSRQKTATVTNKIQHILNKSFLFQQNMSNKSRKVLWKTERCCFNSSGTTTACGVKQLSCFNTKLPLKWK